jgi:predicted solute-binding protein
MNPEAPRVGCVPYLNARPLLEGLTLPIQEMVPAELQNAYIRGDFDVGLLSSIDVISMQNPSVVDGISISSRGAVFSVILAYRGELSSVKRVLLDPASHTSNALLRIILSEFHKLQLEYVRYSDTEYGIPTSDSTARLLIGDQAVIERNRASNHAIRFLDLGEEWFKYTSLPFVYALWILRNEYPKKKELSEALRSAKEHGLFRRSEIAARYPDAEFALRYLTDWIRYDLGEEETRGLELFAYYLKKHNIVSNVYPIIYY